MRSARRFLRATARSLCRSDAVASLLMLSPHAAVMLRAAQLQTPGHAIPVVDPDRRSTGQRACPVRRFRRLVPRCDAPATHTDEGGARRCGRNLAAPG